LIGPEELAERECQACTHEWNLWQRIIEDTGSAIWGRIIFELLSLEEFIEDFRPSPKEVNAREYEYLRVVKLERKRREAYQTWKAGQDAKEGK